MEPFVGWGGDLPSSHSEHTGPGCWSQLTACALTGLPPGLGTRIALLARSLLSPVQSHGRGTHLGTCAAAGTAVPVLPVFSDGTATPWFSQISAARVCSLCCCREV